MKKYFRGISIEKVPVKSAGILKNGFQKIVIGCIIIID